MIDYAELPLPEFQVGKRIHFTPSEWDRRQCLYHLIRYWRAVGDTGGLRGNNRKKELIRNSMHVIDSAHRVTVAGIKPKAMHGADCGEYHVSYIAGNPGASSPLRYHYYLMFEATRGENQVVCIPTYGWSLESITKRA